MDPFVVILDLLIIVLLVVNIIEYEKITKEYESRIDALERGEFHDYKKEVDDD